MVTRVVAMCGLPGSGKSLLARHLARRTGFALLDRDQVRQQVLAAGEGYSPDGKAELNRILCKRMVIEVEAGHSVILDGMTLSREAERDLFADAARAAGAVFLLVWLDCPLAVARDRVAGDGNHPAADRSPALVTAVAERFEPPSHCLRLDARREMSDLFETVMAWLKSNPFQEVDHET